MNYKRLKYFQTVAEHNNVRRAAEILNISQPALSRQIQVLEHEFKATLFNRSNQRIILTPAGKVLKQRVDQIVASMEQLVDDIQSQDAKSKYHLSVGAVQSTLDFLLPKAICVMCRKRPKLILEVHEFQSAEIIDRVSRNALDIGIVATPVSDPRIDVQPILTESFYVVSANAGRFAGQSQTDLATALSEPLVTFPKGFVIRSIIEGVAKNEGLSLRTSVEVESIEAIKALVRAGLGMTILPRSTIMDELQHEDLCFAKIDCSRLKRDIVAIRKASCNPDRNSNYFIDTVRTVFNMSCGECLEAA